MFHTHDQPVTCYECQGTGQVPSEDRRKLQELERCPACLGSGTVWAVNPTPSLSTA